MSTAFGAEPPIWGVLHSIHSTMSDGTETPNQRVDDLKANYHWASPIDHDYMMDSVDWDGIRNEANTNNTDDNFTYFPGYEWRGDSFNTAEITVFFVDNGPSSFAQGSDAAYDTLSEFLEWVQQSNGIGCAAHPARNGNLWDWTDTATDNETLLPCVEIINKDDWYWDDTWDCIDPGLCTNYSNPNPVGAATWTGSVREALNQGRHLGFVAGWDYHGAYPGTPTAYTGLAKVDNWTRPGVFDAILKRHTWAADKKIVMNVTFDNGSEIFYMGDLFNVSSNNIWIDYEINASSGNTISNSSIFIDGIIHNVTDHSSANIQGKFNVTFNNNNEHYIFLETVQDDNTRAWSSPMFITFISTPDTSQPGITIHSPENITYNSTDVNLNVTVNETADAWWFQLNSNSTNITFSPNVTISTTFQGLNNITVWANDSAGNEGSALVYFTYNCVESWSCSGWSSCSGGTQTRICSDSNSCGTVFKKPVESQSCSVYVPPPPATSSTATYNETENETIQEPLVNDTEKNITSLEPYALVNQSHHVVTPENDTVNVVWQNITETESVGIVINSTDMVVSEIMFRVRNRKTMQSKLTVKILEQEVPQQVQATMERKVYKYLEINKTNITDEEIEGNVTIRFHVEKSWLQRNNLSGDNVVLWRYVTNWTQLHTSKTGENSNFVFYEAMSPGFSMFAVGEKEAESEQIPYIFPWWIVQIIAIVTVGIVIIFFSFKYYKRRQQPRIVVKGPYDDYFK